jgi:hypothetical protein
MKTRAEVEKLKRDWEADPCYDLYDMDGFEEYRDELKAYQDQKEVEFKRERESGILLRRKLEPAFPRSYEYNGHNGLTKREYFAAKALQGMMANPLLREWDFTDTEKAGYAVVLADALIEALNQ